MTSRVVIIHRTRIVQFQEEARSLAGAWTKIAMACEEVLAKGGQLHVQPQMQFITGGTVRAIKDLGVIEQTQADGVTARRKTPP